MILPLATAHCQSQRPGPQNWFHRQTRRSLRADRVLLSCTTFDNFFCLRQILASNYCDKYMKLL